MLTQCVSGTCSQRLLDVVYLDWQHMEQSAHVRIFSLKRQSLFLKLYIKSQQKKLHALMDPIKGIGKRKTDEVIIKGTLCVLLSCRLFVVMKVETKKQKQKPNYFESQDHCNRKSGCLLHNINKS